ncbi:unnamed protein product [Cochlearia groenlandica]
MNTPSPHRKKSSMENSITRTWEKMKSFGHTSSSTTSSIKKSKSWHGSFLHEDNNESKGKIKKESHPPHGFFALYVGPTKQRIMVKTKLVNHPLFKNLLEEAENEYGYIRDGPIVLPCEVDHFLNILAHIKSNDDHSGHSHDNDYDDDDDNGSTTSPICGLASPYRPRDGSYKLLRSPSSLFNLHRF